MIRKSNVGVSPNLTISIGNVPVNYQSLMHISMGYATDQHDVAKITMAGIPSSLITEYVGKSVYIKIETGSTYVSEFWGTIQNSKPTHVTSKGMVNHSLFQEVVFTCLGCSYAMRGSTTRVWGNITLEELARTFCDKYGFSLDVPYDPPIFNNLIQSAESDWQVLVRYCHNMGYCLTVHGTHMHIFDPHKAAGRLISLHRISTPISSSVKPHPGQVVSFDGNFARLAADGEYIDAVATVHTDGGNVYDVTTSDMLGKSAPATFSNPMTVVTDNHLQAERLVDSEYKAVYDYSAEATVLGAAGILPGGIINLDKYNAEFDGLWLVDGVSHSVRSGSFTSTIKLLRNKVDTLLPFSVTQIPPPPEPQFISGAWTTTKSLINVYK